MEEQQKKTAEAEEEAERGRARESEDMQDSGIVSSEVSVTIVQDAEIIEEENAFVTSSENRPSKCTDAMIEQICKSVRAGLSYEIAGRAAGLGPNTVQSWIAKGKLGKKPYNKLVAALTKARAQAEQRMAEVVQRCADSEDERISLAASTWWLERRRPERWAKTDKTKLKVEADVAKLTDEELESKIRKLAVERFGQRRLVAKKEGSE